MVNGQRSEGCKSKDLDQVLYNMNIVEIKMDIKEAYLLNESTRSRSQPFPLATLSGQEQNANNGHSGTKVKRRNTIKTSGRNHLINNNFPLTFDVKQAITVRSETCDSFQTEDEDQVDAEEKVELKSILKTPKKEKSNSDII